MRRTKKDKIERVDIRLAELAAARKEQLGIGKRETYREIANYLKLNLPNFPEMENLHSEVKKQKKKGIDVTSEYFKI
jgi:hypothetical protein